MSHHSSSRFLAMLSVGLMCAGLVTLAQQPSPPQVPTFRLGTDLKQITVRVLDKNRQPVRGLTEKDFHVSVNGVPQPVIAVAPEDLGGPVVTTAPWLREAPHDVATNSIANPRLIVIILDDAMFNMGNTAIGEHRAGPSPSGDPWILKQTKAIGHAIVDQLGPTDLATVIFSADNRAPQDFTSDRSRLRAAVDSFHEGPDLEPFIANRYSIGVLKEAIAYLRDVPERPSAIMWVSIGPKVGFSLEGAVLIDRDTSMAEHDAAASFQDQIGALVGQTHVAAVPVYPISPLGIVAPTPKYIAQHDNRHEEVLRMIAASTGGRAVVMTNAPSKAVPGIFEENSYYYVIGYRPTYPLADGKFKRVKIVVDRADVIVEPSERLLLSPTEAQAAMPAAPSRTLATTVALSEIIPVADQQLRLAVAPFASDKDVPSGSVGGRVTLALGVDLSPDDVLKNPSKTIELEVRIFDGEGRRQLDVRRQTARLGTTPSRAPGQYDFLSSLDLKPGRYNLRVSASGSKTGAVYTDVVVPDFAKAALSLSGVAVGVVPGRMATPLREFADLLPIVPSTARTFSPSDRVTTFLRVYWRGDRPSASTSLRITVLDSKNATVFERNDIVTPKAGGASAPKSADVRLDLPLSSLTPGDYLLTFRTTPPKGEAEIRRDVRFSVR